jgi:hypothetical protein
MLFSDRGLVVLYSGMLFSDRGLVVLYSQTCRKPAVPRSDRSFCKKDRRNLGSYRSECPTRFFVEVLLDRDRDLNILTSMRAKWRLRDQFPSSVHGRKGRGTG